MKSNSPWIHQLDKERKLAHLEADVETDVAIVGGGIAGVATAFFILKNTDKQVLLLEGRRLGHGATGHNAGQVTSYFERSFHELVEEFGLEKAAAGQKEIELAWELLDEIYTEASLDIPYSRFTGYAGFANPKQVQGVLKNNFLRRQGGLKVVPILVADHIGFTSEYSDLYKLVPQQEILEKLETKNPMFIALAETQKGVINSALFTEKAAIYLVEKYKERFSILEEAHVGKVVLKEDHALLDVDKFSVSAKRVVLCTNGFDKIQIFNTTGLEINTRFHHSIHGVVARMSGYLEEQTKPPVALSYYVGPQAGLPAGEAGFADMDDPYFYLTRREYEYNHHQHDLICFGGPQQALSDRAEFNPEEFDYPEAEQSSDKFIHELYNIDLKEKIEYIYTWHGLMGYTPNGVRLVGAEPKNPVLLYNLGCNGVGILPSIFGGKRISQIVKGEKLLPSIFDPKDH